MDILKQAREVYKNREEEYYLETIRKTADELERLQEENRIMKQRESIIIKKYEDLKYSVKRWFALLEKDNETAEEVKDFVEIKEKLSKVGDEE